MMITSLRALAAVGLLTFAAHAVAQQVAVPIGQPLQVPLPAQGVTNAAYIDVPDGAERLHIRFDGPAGSDVGLLVRYGTPFSGAPEGASLWDDWLINHSHYYSISTGHEESVVITRAGREPLRSGRWYLSLLNLGDQPAQATLRATLGGANDFVPIEMVFNDNRWDCDTSGWNDPSLRTPVRGNAGTTLGQQRRLAAMEAARLLSEEIRPNALIRVQACWETLESENTLAQAGPTLIFMQEPGAQAGLNALSTNATYLPHRYVTNWGTIAVHRGGAKACQLWRGQSCANPFPDVAIEFNYGVDTRSDAGRHYDYGFTHGGSNTNPSFISVAMHEIAHGLGFAGRTGLTTGAQPETPFGARYDDIYGHHARYVVGNTAREFLRLTNEERLTAMTSQQGLKTAGPFTIDHPHNPWRGFPAPTSFVELHAPPTIAPGSTYSHVAATNHLIAPQLMSASIHASAPRSLGMALGVFRDLGYDQTPRAPRAPKQVLQSQYYDVDRNGHGFEIRRVDGIPGVEDLYFVIFYSYDAQGRPEFYNAVGRIVDGKFLPPRNEHHDSLVRPRYRGPGDTIADPDPGFSGDLLIDFEEAARHPVCVANASGRAGADSLAVMTWEVNGQRRQWCMQPLVEGRDGVATDFSNQWWDPNDAGWGMSVLSFPGQGGDGLGLQLYFPDAAGNGRWALVQTPTYTRGGTYPVLQPIGYCRTCDAPGEQQFKQIGTITIDLRAPGDGASAVSFDVTFDGPEGGRFQRSGATIVPVGTPNY